MSASALGQVQMPHWRFSVDDYERMAETGILHEDDRVELIEGEIILMPPIGSPHGGRVNRLNHILSAAVGERAIVAPQNPIVLGHHQQGPIDLSASVALPGLAGCMVDLGALF